MKLKGIVSTVVAISAGLIVLLGFFLPIPALQSIRYILLEWATLLAGVATLLGVSNLLSVHFSKIRTGKSGALNSLVLVLFFIVTLALAFVPSLDPFYKILLNGIMVPVEISLMGLLAITLVYASVRLLRLRANLTSILFLGAAILILLGTGPWPFLGQLPIFNDVIRPFLANFIASGGARGILLGVALGTLFTGLRILFGADRPYGGN